jgi:hypothetical protein
MNISNIGPLLEGKVKRMAKKKGGKKGKPTPKGEKKESAAHEKKEEKYSGRFGTEI